jgi:hypothetical protein
MTAISSMVMAATQYAVPMKNVAMGCLTRAKSVTKVTKTDCRAIAPRTANPRGYVATADGIHHRNNASSA